MNGTVLIKFTTYLKWYLVWCIAVAFLIPANTRVIAPFISDLIDLANSFFPAIGSWSRKSKSLADVVSVFIALQWFLMPAFLFFLTTKVRLGEFRPEIGRFKRLLAGLFFIGLAFLLAYVFSFLELKDDVNLARRVDRGNMMIKAITQTRLGLGLMAGSAFLAIHIFVALPVQAWFFSSDKEIIE